MIYNDLRGLRDFIIWTVYYEITKSMIWYNSSQVSHHCPYVCFHEIDYTIYIVACTPHTQYISKCWPTYFHGLHSYQNVGTSCSAHIMFSWVAALDRQVISPFDLGTWVVHICGVLYFPYSVVLSRGSWESWPGYLWSMLVEAS